MSERELLDLINAKIEAQRRSAMAELNRALFTDGVGEVIYQAPPLTRRQRIALVWQRIAGRVRAIYRTARYGQCGECDSYWD